MAQAGIIIAVMGVLKKWFPPAPLNMATALSMEELKAKYRRLDRVGDFLGFGSYLAVSGVLYGLFEAISWVGPHSHDLVQMPCARLFIRVLMGLLLGLFLSMPVTVAWVVPRLAGERTKEYMAYGASKLGFDPRKIAMRLFLPMGLLFLPLMCLSADWYEAFGDDAIYVNSYWTIGQEVRRPYTDVSDIIQVDGYNNRWGRFMNAPHYVIKFSDGATINTSKATSSNPDPPQLWQELASLVSRRSGKPIDHGATYP